MYYQQAFNASGAAADSAADVVVVVDESGSIHMKALWIRQVLSNTNVAIFCVFYTLV